MAVFRDRTCGIGVIREDCCLARQRVFAACELIAVVALVLFP